MSGTAGSSTKDYPTTMRGPVIVRKLPWRCAWVWQCTIHIRCRGVHHRQHRIDQHLKRYKKLPRPHPWETAMQGAVEHWHKFHAPTHICCLPKTARKVLPANPNPTSDNNHPCGIPE